MNLYGLYGTHTDTDKESCIQTDKKDRDILLFRKDLYIFLTFLDNKRVLHGKITDKKDTFAIWNLFETF